METYPHCPQIFHRSHCSHLFQLVCTTLTIDTLLYVHPWKQTLNLVTKIINSSARTMWHVSLQASANNFSFLTEKVESSKKISVKVKVCSMIFNRASWKWLFESTFLSSIFYVLHVGKARQPNLVSGELMQVGNSPSTQQTPKRTPLLTPKEQNPPLCPALPSNKITKSPCISAGNSI